MSEEKMPALPETHYNAYSDGSEPLYTAEMMHDYAAAFRAEGEAALRAQLTEAQQTLVDHGEIQASLCKQLTASEASRKELREAAEEALKFLAHMNGPTDKLRAALADDAEQKGGGANG